MRMKLLALVLFSIAFAFVEAAVVFYLRRIFDFRTYPTTAYHNLINLGFMAFLSGGSQVLPDAKIMHAEVLREVATIIMLAAIAFISGVNFKQRAAAFLIAFSIWDLFYYAFLKYLTGWPTSVWSIDVYFLNPVPSAGLVIFPLILFSFTLVFGLIIYIRQNK